MRLVTKRGVRMLASATVLAACFVARPAAADYDLQFAAGFGAGYLRKTPALTGEGASTTARDVPKGTVASRGGALTMLGGTFDMQLTFDDRWMLPLLGGNLSWAVGSYDRVASSLDGSVFTYRPHTAFRGDLYLVGFGRRWKHRRNMFSIAARTGFSRLAIDGSVAAGADAIPMRLVANTFLFQIEAEGCRRLDPERRICLQVAPRIYEHEAINGVTFGLRMEWGR